MLFKKLHFCQKKLLFRLLKQALVSKLWYSDGSLSQNVFLIFQFKNLWPEVFTFYNIFIAINSFD